MWKRPRTARIRTSSGEKPRRPPFSIRYAVWRSCPDRLTCSPMSWSRAPRSSSSRSSGPSRWRSAVASKSWTASEATWRAWRWRQFERRHSASTDERRSARGSLPSSAGSCAPIAVSTIPSRSAHSLTVSSFSPVAAIRWPSTEMPAGTSSARRTSQPGSLARSSTVSSKIFADTAARSLALTVSWFTASGSEPSRIAAAMRASDTKVPEEPISSFGWRSAISASTGASSEAIAGAGAPGPSRSAGRRPRARR